MSGHRSWSADRKTRLADPEIAPDLYLSTLPSYVAAMGGELQLRAVFPDGQAAILSVGQLLEPAGIGHAPALPAADADLHAVFAVLILQVADFEAAEEEFRATLAA